MASDRKSPLKRAPLRTPGQSLQKQLWDLLLDDLLAPWLATIVLVGFTALELFRVWFASPPMPWLFAAIALGAGFYAVWRTRRTLRRIDHLRLALDGELAVGQFLEELRRKGFAVFHDLQGEGFNIDHALVGPKGIFTIETKTWRKPPGPEARIVFDGEELRAAGFLPSRDPIIQGKAQASWLSSLLEELTGRKVRVKPVVLFAGWFVEQAKGTHRDIWVLNPKALPDFLSNEPERLSPDDLKLFSSHLSRHIRAEVSRERGRWSDGT